MILKYNEFITETIVYHGSPYDFSYFSNNAIGSGEGNTGFGYGFYFSSDKNDAKEYARKLEQEEGEARLYKVRIPDKKYFLDLDKELTEQNSFVKNCLKEIDDDIKINVLRNFDFDYNDFKYEFDESVKNGEYNFEIDSDEYKSTLKDIINNEFMNIGCGRDLYHSLENELDEYDASDCLHEVGILGNMHTDFGILNYVVFDDEDIEIIGKTKPRFKNNY
jgi:hypothetical protein